MKKATLSILTTAVFLSANIAFAQNYYPYYTAPAVPASTACVNFSSDLSYGMRGNDVRALQNFILTQNYPGAGSWMLTGYFGKATETAVRSFQSLHALPITGVVDGITRSAITRTTCGFGYQTYQTPTTNPYVNPFGNSSPYTPTFNTGYVYNTPSSCGGFGGANVCGTPSIQYLTPNSGAAGSSVSIFGTGFSATGNSVKFADRIVTITPSPDGRSVSFKVPTLLPGFVPQPTALATYPVSVTNAQGATSNTLPFTVTSLGSSGAPTIGSVNGPTTLVAGVQGTWTINLNSSASSYVTTSVNWGDQTQYGTSAPQTLAAGQQTLTFTHTYATNGVYAVTFTVSNANGSNLASATVSVSGSGTSGPLSIQYLSPSSGSVGTLVTIQGSGFTSGGNVVHFGVGGKVDVASSNGNGISFTVPSYVSPCDLISSGTVCGAPVTQVTPGTYPLYITNSTGATNVLYFVVL